MLCEIKGGTVTRGGQTVLSHFDFFIRGSEKIAVVGRNGAGKTTLLEVLSGIRELDPDEKHPEAGMSKSRKFSVGFLRQQTEPEMLGQTLDGYLAGMHAADDAGGFPPDTDADGAGRLPSEFAAGGAVCSAPDFEADRMLCVFGLSKADRQKKISAFSGGEQVKIRLIRLLLEAPEVLLLDEPTNHLDLKAVEWLEQYIRDYRGAVVMVSHDRYFLDQTASVTCEIEAGRVTRYAGNYSQYREEKARRYAKQRGIYERQQEEIRRLDSLILKFRNKPSKASFAKSRKKLLERMETVPEPRKDMAVIHAEDILPARKGPKIVYECEKLCIGYEKDKPLRDISLRIRRGSKLAVLGPNGSGKTAFLKTVAGILPPLSGKGSMRALVDPAYLDQMSASMDVEETVLSLFHAKYPSLTDKEARAILAGYLFTGRDVCKRVCDLSGGEKTRLLLASLLQAGPNFLLLDEPTNNMDIPAKETLESIFRAYKGTILFVTHDRYFLSRVADSLLIFNEDGTVLYYPFGYAHYKSSLRGAGAADLAALRSSEEQRLIEGLRDVPKAQPISFRMSEKEMEKDWLFSRNMERLMAARDAYEKALSELARCPETPEEYENFEAVSAARQEAAQEALTEWTAACIERYDLHLELDDGARRE